MPLVSPSQEFDQSVFPLSKHIVGFDEVGRGCLAGPLVVAAVVLPTKLDLPDPYGDSKALKEPYRTSVADFIKKNAIEYSIVRIENVLIDRIGITKCLEYAYEKSIRRLSGPIDGIILDGRQLNNKLSFPQQAVIQGDTKSAAVAAASIIAKVYRDRLMTQLSLTYPHYGFELHKGYGTQLHRQKLREYGPCVLHRLSFLGNYDVFS